jgi:tetratricopeptide (TPR) repeat protein
LTHLARIADLKVISRTSVMQYKSGAPRNLREIGQQLGVAHVVEGSVQRAANKVRVIAQLIDARNDAHLWAQTYDRDLADVFAIQSEIAKAIADQLQAKLSPAEKAAIEQPPTENLKAYDLYTEAKHLLMVWIGSKDSKESITRAIALLERATREDPKFALAYCLAVTAHINIYFYGVERTPTQLTAAKQALDAAIQLAPELGETHLAVAYYNHFVLHDFDTARRELELALRTIPNNADAILELSYIDRRQGRWEECLAGMRRANVLDPRNIEVIRAIADTLLITRRYREEVEFMTRQITLVPESASLGYMKLAECNLAAGDLDEAGKALQSMPADYDPNGFGSLYRYHAALFARDAARAQEVVAHSAPGKLPESPGSQFFPSPSWFRGEIALAQHDAAAAKAAFLDARRDFVAIYGDQPTDPFQLAALARIDAMVGRKAEAISEAKRAVELRPVSKDAIAGPWVAKCLAAVCSWTGERNAALEQLEQLARTPGTGDTSYGELKFNPWWDDLRGDPRFEQIVASLAPKDSK